MKSGTNPGVLVIAGKPMIPSLIQGYWTRVGTTIAYRVEVMRDQLAHIEALPQLTLLGLLTGILASFIIVLFRWMVDIPLAFSLPVHSENFEALPSATRFFLPVAGGLILGLILQGVNKHYHATGIAHVLDRLNNHQGRMPLGNSITQLIGGAICLLSGHSVGREGPAVHLGAASGSLLGQWLSLPNNSLRPLAGCGVAAAIAASFNTPMAGVIFAMEVVVMEYTIAGFIPVILAAVAGTTITHLIFGPDITFITPQTVMGNLFELPLMAMTGLIVAVFAAAFIYLQGFCCRHSLDRPIWLRFLIAGLVTGFIALWVPEIMGVGYDSINAALAGQIGLGLLLAIVIAKLIATAVSLGVGVPGGVVGPCLVMGATLGGAMGVIAQLLMPDSASNLGFYVILGMGAMMGAVLNAPLAAMMAILELTYNPHIIFPGMLVVVVACLTTRWVFRCDGLFQTLLRIQGKEFAAPGTRSQMFHHMLSRSGVRGLMDRHFLIATRWISCEHASELLQRNPQWIVLDEEPLLIHPADLQKYIEGIAEAAQAEMIDLMDIPISRSPLGCIGMEANLYQALLTMNTSQVDALCVTRNDKTSNVNSHRVSDITGIITREKLNS